MKIAITGSTSILGAYLSKFLKKKGPGLCQIIMSDTQILIPRVQTKISKKGKFLPTNIDDMYPYLSRKEYQNNVLYGKKNK